VNRFEDDRGVIQDLLGPVDAVTEISTKRGAVRGNHIHMHTDQWTYVVSGSIQTAANKIYTSGMFFLEAAGIPHAWTALEDSVTLVFTKGPRSGENYESDVTRLKDKLI
jgi:quercetin dioxygenase-like cupin family protein